MTLEHRSSHKQHGDIYSNSQKYIVWVKIIHFYFMPKIIRILRSCSMKIFCTFSTLNISQRNFWLVICITKNFIWTTLKMIFSIFRFVSRFSNSCISAKYCPIITNHTSMETLFIQLSDFTYDCFCAPKSHTLKVFIERFVSISHDFIIVFHLFESVYLITLIAFISKLICILFTYTLFISIFWRFYRRVCSNIIQLIIYNIFLKTW